MNILKRRVCAIAVLLCFSTCEGGQNLLLPELQPNPTPPPFILIESFPAVPLFSYNDFVYFGGATVSAQPYQAGRFRARDGQLDDWRLENGAFLFTGSREWLIYATAKNSPPAPRLISAVNFTTQQTSPYTIEVAEDISCFEGYCPYVATLAVGKDWCYVGGSFSTNSASSLFRFDVQTGVTEALNVEGINDVRTMVADEDRVYAASRRIGAGPPGRLAAVAHDNTNRTQWSLELTDVWSLHLKGERLWLAGDFESVAGVPRSNLASLNPQTGAVLPAPFQFTFDGFSGLSIVGEFGEYLVVYGNFSAVNGQRRDRLAAVQPLTGEVHPWSPGFGKDVSGRVTALVTTERHVYVAGQFSEIGGLPRESFAVFDLIAPPEMSAPKLEATGFTAQVKAASTYAHELQRSGDLGRWENVSTNTPTTAEFTVFDPVSAATDRYYRILLQ